MTRPSATHTEAGSARIAESPGSVTSLRRECVSTNTAVRDLLQDVASFLDQNSVARADVETAEVVLAEAMNNVVEHAYQWRQDGSLQLGIDLRAGEIIFTLTDRGQPLPDLRLPDKRQHDLDVPLEDLPEGGFGWFLIHSLTTHLSYRRAEGINHLCFHLVREVE